LMFQSAVDPARTHVLSRTGHQNERKRTSTKNGVRCSMLAVRYRVWIAPFESNVLPVL